MGLVQGWALDGLCFPDDEGCSTVAQADTDKANNRGLGTATCKPQLMHLCRQDAIQFFCPCRACLIIGYGVFFLASAQFSCLYSTFESYRSFSVPVQKYAMIFRKYGDKKY